MKRFFTQILGFFLSFQVFLADRNIQLVSQEQNNLNTYSKQTDMCYDAYGVFVQPFYSKFFCTDVHPTTATNSSIPVFDISNLPPHFKRDLRIELYSVKYSGLSASFKLDNLSPIPYTFNINGDERLKLPCQRNSSDPVAQDGDFYYNFNINTTTIPSMNTYTIFSIIETSQGCTQSYLRIKAIQYNVENCDNTCLQCSGTSTSCTKCDATCSTLQSSSCILNNSNYILQEGKCVTNCSSPHFNINGKCVWIPNCSSVTSGSIYCTSCQNGFLPMQTNNYEAQCQYQNCPNDYEIVSGVCQDKKRNLQGSYLLQALYSFTFSSFEIDKNGLIYTNFVNVNNYSSKYTRCGNYQLFGGYFSYRNTSLIATKQYTTTSKYVRVSFKWILIDYTNSTNPIGLNISVVGSTSGTQSIQITGITPSQICGLSANDYVGNFQYDFLVSNGKVTLNILNQMPATISTKASDNDGDFNKYQYFGIRELFIYQLNIFIQQSSSKNVFPNKIQINQYYYPFTNLLAFKVIVQLVVLYQMVVLSVLKAIIYQILHASLVYQIAFLVQKEHNVQFALVEELQTLQISVFVQVNNTGMANNVQPAQTKVVIHVVQVIVLNAYHAYQTLSYTITSVHRHALANISKILSLQLAINALQIAKHVQIIPLAANVCLTIIYSQAKTLAKLLVLLDISQIPQLGAVKLVQSQIVSHAKQILANVQNVQLIIIYKAHSKVHNAK
ncbi:hypothetical protein TTHERM_00059530 (macronuclear) [Tetrahymena thermophila SB210]|uniref:Transmembrane protein n=1 Tax=Tetrahymena thermophila (strain SB210) TaxID=312017 RepID=I7M0E9_TETTS|nr:hypothetical protein TTHERM_00059530 [Tetrahymena thermophila SB210]EAR87440.2 hypothetical protein TTHERM_00059530 [Tetrahymena thermophila SB210]|eukprot:XP_001007685.2 hypothetical protein TTHERM_00059530 [Tetrahymena thermophila SB210]